MLSRTACFAPSRFVTVGEANQQQQGERFSWQHRVENNHFSAFGLAKSAETRRGYYDGLPKSLREDQKKWGPKHRILDTGAGTAQLFCDRILAQVERGEALPKYVALAAHRPQLADIRGDEANQRFLVGAIQKLEDVLNTYAENLVYLEGYLGTRTTVEAKAASKGLEEATGKEFNAIIDRAGVDGYSEDLSGVFWAKGRLLKTGGRSYSQFRPETPLGPDIEIRTPKGEIILQEAWFLAMRGLVPTFEETGNGSAGGIVLTRNEEPLFIPELYLDLSKSWKGNQITRVYVWPDYQKDIL